MTKSEQTQWLALAVSALCGIVIPQLVDLLTKSHASHAFKAYFAAVLSAAAGALSTVQLAAGERWSTYVLAIAVAFVTTMAMHATGYSNPMQQATAGFGFGPANPAPSDPLRSTPSDQQTGAGVVGPANTGE